MRSLGSWLAVLYLAAKFAIGPIGAGLLAVYGAGSRRRTQHKLGDLIARTPLPPKPNTVLLVYPAVLLAFGLVLLFADRWTGFLVVPPAFFLLASAIQRWTLASLNGGYSNGAVVGTTVLFWTDVDSWQRVNGTFLLLDKCGVRIDLIAAAGGDELQTRLQQLNIKARTFVDPKS